MIENNGRNLYSSALDCGKVVVEHLLVASAPIIFESHQEDVGLDLAHADHLEHSRRTRGQVHVVDERTKSFDVVVAEVFVRLFESQRPHFARLLVLPKFKSGSI